METQPTQSNKIQPVQVAQWALVAAGLFVMYKILKGTGLIKTGTEIAAEKANDQIMFEDYTKPTFWKQPAPSGKKVVTFNLWEDWTRKMYDTAGYFTWDDAEAMQGLIRQLTYKTQYSFLADKFQTKYNEDLTAWLKNFFNEDELYPAWKHLEDLPTYAKA